MPEESEVIYWVIDEDGNVLPDLSPQAGDYNIGDRLELEGKSRRVVERFPTDDHPNVIWVKTVVESD